MLQVIGGGEHTIPASENIMIRSTTVRWNQATSGLPSRADDIRLRNDSAGVGHVFVKFNDSHFSRVLIALFATV